MRCGFAVVLALGTVMLTDADALAQRRGPRPRRGDESGAAHGWLSSLDAGRSQARATGKPLMVVIRCVP